MHPVANLPITTPYKKYGSSWSLGWHTGVDYSTNGVIGVNVVAPAPGYVARVAYDNSYGNYIMLRCVIDGKPYNVYLCHLSKALVSAGAQVQMGQHIGESGNTGNSSGPHLHLEVRESPYGFNGNDIVDPAVVYNYTGTTLPSAPTVFDICAWNIARPRWYTPWAGRAAEVARELNDEASVYCFQELFESGPIATVKAALPECDQFSGPAGLEFFYDRAKWVRVAATNHYSGIANRWAQEVTLKRVATGRVVTFFNVHAPIKAEGDTAKARYGAWLAGKVKTVTNPVVIAGDLNTSSDAYSPKKELRAIGYIGYKEQAAIVNESTGEAIPSGKDYCDIRTNPAGPADVTGGQVDLSTNSVESDHRRIEARVTVAPKVEPAPAPVDLTNWKLTLPTPLGGESPTEIKQPALATYENPPYFDRRPDGLGFRAPVDGAHTPNSSYPRSELRELRPGGDWSTSAGVHEMVVEQAITAVPGDKPHVVAGQIHDASDDVVMVRLEGTRLFVESDGDEVALLTDSYQLGSRFRVSIRTDGTGIYVYFNGVGGRVLQGSWSSCYFKAGCYTQANESNGTGYGEVVVYSLDVTHG